MGVALLPWHCPSPSADGKYHPSEQRDYAALYNTSDLRTCAGIPPPYYAILTAQLVLYFSGCAPSFCRLQPLVPACTLATTHPRLRARSPCKHPHLVPLCTPVWQGQ